MDLSGESLSQSIRQPISQLGRMERRNEGNNEGRRGQNEE